LKEVGADPAGTKQQQVSQIQQDNSDRLSKGVAGRAVTAGWQGKAKLSRGIEKADQAMGEINQEVEKAKQDLSKIVKMYPPYPQDSKERAELLNSYLGLRKQIEKLTVPPESDLAAEILGGSEKSDLPEELTGFTVDAGPQGLDLVESPVAGEELRDEDLPPLIEDLERASETLQEKRQALRLSAAEFFGLDEKRESDYVRLSAETKDQLSSVPTAGMIRQSSGIHIDLSRLVWN
jgi:DNA repair exonuclease SbcCD ATPase subunit